jgi:siroheme synthase (precorrin-2 oxidase/ferrochelatase)
MQNILTLPLCQGSYSESKNHEKINNLINHGTIELISYELSEENVQGLEEISVAKAIETLKKMLLPTKEAVQVFSNLEQARLSVKIYNERQAVKLPANITETPKFYEAKNEPVELSVSTRDTFARIGERAREAFIEEQVERANLYNIPYKNYGDDYYRLMVNIDKYEYLLEKAKDYCVDWDISEYDLMALEQAIEEAEHNAYLHDQELRSYFSLTRGVEV